MRRRCFVFSKLTVLAALISSILLPLPVQASDDCPQSWQINTPKLELSWDSAKQLVNTNIGVIGNSYSESVSVDFNSVQNSGLLKAISKLYGDNFESKIKANSTKLTFRSWLLFGSKSSELKDLNSSIRNRRFLFSNWQSTSNSFSGFDPKSLLRLGIVNGATIQHLLEIRMLGCSDNRFVSSIPATVQGIPDSYFGFGTPMGMTTWKAGVEEYLNYMISTKSPTSIRSLNTFNWSVNLERFEFLVSRLKTLDKDSPVSIEDGEEVPFSAKDLVQFNENAMCGGEDCTAMVPSLVGYSPANCMFELKVYVTPCKVAIIGSDGSKADKKATSIWAINDIRIQTVIGTFEIPKRRMQSSYYESQGIRIAKNLIGNDLRNKTLPDLLLEVEKVALTSNVYDLEYGKATLLASAEKILKERLETLAKTQSDALAAEAKAKAERDAKALAEAAECNRNKERLVSLEESYTSALKVYPRKSAWIMEKIRAIQTGIKSICTRSESVDLLERDLKSLMALPPQVSSKRSSITCIKGKLTKKVTGINPKCPKGYKKK